MTDPPPRVYARCLLPFNYGYPLWTPEPGNQFLRYRRDGLRIGDVGVIVPENGSFDVFFNVCLPADHPFHRVNGVPNNFVRVNLEELDVAIYPHAENPGSVISTSSVTTLRTIEPSTGAGHQNALTYEFSLSSGEGALLILPEGAESYDLLKKRLFRDVATRNAVDWYNFAEQQLGRIITHDSLYLITGCHKSHSWSVAAFHGASSHTGATEFPAQFKAGQARQGNISTAYTWETERALHWRVGPLGNWIEIPNQTTFIGGFKIAIRDNILGRKRVEVELHAPPVRSKATKFFSGSKGRSGAGKLWGRFVPKSGGNKEAGERAQADSVNNSGADSALDDVSVGISHMPEALESCHPSDIVNQYLLNKEPSASVAVTHDSQWGILLEKGILRPEDLIHNSQLERIISENYRLVSQDGVVSLQKISDSSIRLTDIGDAVREAWKEDRLDDAEEILSRQIIRRTGSDHSAFANRALIRARLHHWDASLRDAETSIDIQPSVTAHIAKGFALFGQQKYTFALHAFNVALHECEGRDKVLVSLVKCIVLFEVGYRAESVAGIADLIEHCLVEVKSACSATQAEMYVRLATSAIKNEDYDRALQLLTRGQLLEPFHAIPEFEFISLICGWRFDNLQFNIHRHKCEVLCVARRTNEAVDLFRTLKRDFGDNIGMKKENAEWLTMFTERCIKSLENLGDSALALQNYTEAITHYSAALSMDPTTREGILVKRSNVYLITGAWNDALNDADEAITLNPLSPWGHERKVAALQGMGRHDEGIQAFNSMLFTLERLTYSHTPRHIGSTMAIQRVDPRLPTHHIYPPRRNLDRRLIIGSIMTASQDVDSRRVTDILGILRAERDEMVRESNAFPSIGQPEQVEEQQLGVVDETSGASIVASDERENKQLTAPERYYKLRGQLADLVRQYHEDDKHVSELMKMKLPPNEQQLVPRSRQDEPIDIPVLELLDELHMHNTMQRKLLDTLSSYWMRDKPSSKGKEQERDGGTDSEQMPYSFRSLREDFISALAADAQRIVEEIARLGEERRRLQQEIGQYMVMRSKYGPGGEFEPEWRPPASRVPERFTRAHSQQEPKRTVALPLPTRTRSTSSRVTRNSRPGWRSIEPVTGQRPASTIESIHLESSSVGLLGPSTPRSTSLLDIEPDAELDPISMERASMTGPTLPPEALPLELELNKPMLFSTPHSVLPTPGLGHSVPSEPYGTPSAPSPLSFTPPPPLGAFKSIIPEKLAPNEAKASLTDYPGGAIDI